MSDNYIDRLFGSAKYKEQVEEFAPRVYQRKLGSAAKAVREWRSRNPDAMRAHAAVKYALKTGKLVRGSCFINDQYCHGRTEAHHLNGYAKEHWLDVVWLCKYHHELADTKK